MLGLDAAARQADPPTGPALEAMLAAWDTALAEVPTPRLSGLLIDALQHRRGPFPLTTGDVLAELDAQRPAWALQAAPPPRPVLPSGQTPTVDARCDLCAGEGRVGTNGQDECPRCWGTGQVCPTCHGARWVVQAAVGRVGEPFGRDRYPACPVCAGGPRLPSGAEHVSGSAGPRGTYKAEMGPA